MILLKPGKLIKFNEESFIKLVKKLIRKNDFPFI